MVDFQKNACAPKCDRPSDPYDGRWKCECKLKSGGCRDGSKCEVKCDTGFYVNETVKGIECKDGRSWHVDSGAKWWRMDFRVCLPKCSKPEDPKNGRFVCDENCDLDSGNG